MLCDLALTHWKQDQLPQCVYARSHTFKNLHHEDIHVFGTNNLHHMNIYQDTHSAADK